jgi:hypothetical protein
MKKISIVLCLVAFLGLAFSPSIISSNNENSIVLTDTTKAVKKTKTKTKSDCSKSCGHSCTSKKTTTTSSDDTKKKK